MACQWCGSEIDLSAELPGSEVRCKCGAFVRVPDAPATHADAPPRVLRCARCGHALEAATEGGVTLHACGTCAGVFAERATIEELGKGMRATAEALVVREEPSAPPSPIGDTARYVRCPSCQAIMNRKNFGHRSGVIIDVCRDHGAWFDADELALAARFVMSGGIADGPPDRSESPDAARRRAEAKKTAAEVEALGVAEGYREARRQGRNAWFAGSLVGLIVEWVSS